MLNDIYGRDPEASNYNSTQLEVNDELNDLILKIENTLFTRKTEVLGDTNFGANLDDLVFSLVLNEGAIKNSIMTQISNYCVVGDGRFKVNVQVQFFTIPERDGAFIDIYINDQRVIGAIF